MSVEAQLAAGVSFVIPARNEEATIRDVVTELRRAHPDAAEIIVVDDGSTDRTASRAREAGAAVVAHPVSRGYGAAIKSGIISARGTLRSGDFISPMM